MYYFVAIAGNFFSTFVVFVGKEGNDVMEDKTNTQTLQLY
jgi:hypothetical protein